MDWEIIYYNEAVRLWVDSLPVGIRAYYARITAAMRHYGPNLGLPYTRAMGDELFEIRARGKKGIARIFYCTVFRSGANLRSKGNFPSCILRTKNGA